MSYTDLSALNGTLAEAIGQDLLSTSLANDVLFGRLDFEEAQEIYYHEKLLLEMTGE